MIIFQNIVCKLKYYTLEPLGRVPAFHRRNAYILFHRFGHVCVKKNARYTYTRSQRLETAVCKGP